jgi:hypothetical protein
MQDAVVVDESAGKNQAGKRAGRDGTQGRRDEFSHFLLFYERSESFYRPG